MNLVAGASSSQGLSRSTPSLLRLFCFVPVGCQRLLLFNALPLDPTLSRAQKIQACYKPSKIMHTIDMLATERTRNDNPQNHEMGFGEMSTTCRETIKRGTSASTPGTQLTFVNPLTSYLTAGWLVICTEQSRASAKICSRFCRVHLKRILITSM